MKFKILLLLSIFFISVSSCKHGLPECGVEYRIDDAYQNNSYVIVTYTIINTGKDLLRNVELEIIVLNDAGNFFAGLTSRTNLSNQEQETNTISIPINGVFTKQSLPGTNIPQNVYVTGVWFNETL